MAWWLGKNIGRPQGGWIKQGLQRNQELKQRGMDVPQPEYNQGAMQSFQNAATQGGQAAAFGRGGMADAMGMYGDAAAGKGTSVAQAQLAQSGQQTIADQQAMAAQARGGNLGSQARQAGAAGAAAQMGTAQNMATLRAQEIDAARAGLAGTSAQYAQGGLAQQGMGLGLQGQAAGQQLASETQWGLGQRGLDLEQLQGNRGFGLGMMQGITGAAGTGAGIAMLSDMRAKEDVVASGGAATEAARAANPINFEYREGMGPPGPRTGVSANSLATTPAGAAVVTPDPNSGMLTVDPAQLSGLSMAATSENTHRVDSVQARMDRVERLLAGLVPTSTDASEEPKKKKRKGLADRGV